MITIEANNIPEAYVRLLCEMTYKEGGEYKNIYLSDIDSGSFGANNNKGEVSSEAQKRYQAPFVALRILNPETRMLSPDFPSGVPAICSEEIIEAYFANKIMNPSLEVNETYTYASRLLAYPVDGRSGTTFNQLKWIIEHLKKFPGNNHCTVTIALAQDLNLKHAPCLRELDFKCVNGKLNIAAWFRSWDVYGALPINLGGFQLLNEFICQEAGLEPGEMHVATQGAHIYSSSIDLCEARYDFSQV